jgi:ATP-dependent helicase/nuclease subunit B
MGEGGGGEMRPRLYTIPPHRSFADALAAGLIGRFGGEPLGLARGRLLLPNNRAVRAVTDAFVRASGSGLLLPRLIPIGDPDLDERIGGALDPAEAAETIPPAVEPLERLLALAALVRGEGESAAEAFRLASDLARTLDALTIEEVDPQSLKTAAAEAEDLAAHWNVSLQRLEAVLDRWPALLKASGKIDLSERRNGLLRRLAEEWRETPPQGFTVAAGITTAAPAVATLLGRIARMPEGMVVLPGLSLANVMPDEEWDALGPDEQGRGEATHPQFHLKLLLDRMGIAREEVELWRAGGRSASPAVRGRAVAHAMTAADFSDKWNNLKPAERRLTGIRAAELPDAASEAQVIALAIREAIEEPGKTAALVTPDRVLAERVSALLRRWNIDADDSAGRALGQTPAGTLLLGIAAVAAEDFAPVPLLALLKHPLVGGEDKDRAAWLEQVRLLDLALRGPRPPAGIDGLDQHCRQQDKEWVTRGCEAAWAFVRPRVAPLSNLFGRPVSLAQFAAAVAAEATELTGDRARRGPDGRMAADLLASLQELPEAQAIMVGGDDAVPLLRDLLDRQQVRPPYGGHPRVFIWGLLEARLQQADFLILGGLNEGVWPALPAPDPWLAPKIRSNLGLPTLEFRVGLSAHDFASALGAPRVLVTRARRDGRSPTVASRFWLRLEAMTGGLARDIRLERIAAALDNPGAPKPVDRPEPQPPVEDRPTSISVTAVDRLKADPFAFYAQAMLKLRSLDPVDADFTAAWKGSAVHKVLEEWLKHDNCDPAALRRRALDLLSSERIHPMLRALWQPRLMEAIDWIAELEESNQSEGRLPLAAEAEGTTELAGVTIKGKADRIDRLPGDAVAIVDYKTGQAPKQKAIDAGFSLQLGLLGLIARAGGFGEHGGSPQGFEYWSLTKQPNGSFGKVSHADKDMGADEFLGHAEAHFRSAAETYLTGGGKFTAKLHPAYAPYGDYDQLMRLEEWYGRDDR